LLRSISKKITSKNSVFRAKICSTFSVKSISTVPYTFCKLPHRTEMLKLAIHHLGLLHFPYRLLGPQMQSKLNPQRKVNKFYKMECWNYFLRSFRHTHCPTKR